MNFRLSSKLNVIVLVLLLSIGFAAVATNLIINGNARISSNPADFDVIFIEATAYWGGSATISYDKKAITWNSATLTELGEKTYLDFTVYNNSSNFDANVIINMNIEDVVNHVDYSEYYTIRTTTFDSTGYTLVPAKEGVEGSIEVELVKPVTEDVTLNFTMSMSPNPIERDSNIGPAVMPCSIVRGTGYNFGDEITCRGENFYLLESKDNVLTLLSKYNLMSGDIYGEVQLPVSRYTELKNTYIGTNTDVKEILNEPEFSEYKAYNEEFEGNIYIYDKNDQSNTIIVRKELGLRGHNVEEFIPHQDSRAIGAHGNELGQPDYPEVGIQNTTYAIAFDNDTYETYFIDSPSHYDFLLEKYERYLNNYNIFINGIDVLGLGDINYYMSTIYLSPLPIKEWFDNQSVFFRSPTESSSSIFILGSIKDYLPDEYAWLYSTTYWTKTAINSTGLDLLMEKENIDASRHTYFVDTLGLICSQYGCSRAIGAGIRPVIKLNDMYLDYSTATSNGIDE